MMQYDYKQLPELRFMKHRHDNNDSYVDYEKFILDKSLSPHIYESDKMKGFLDSIQPLVANMFDRFNIVKNWKNYMVDKYHYKQKG
jgi:hypothetical protein